VHEVYEVLQSSVFHILKAISTIFFASFVFDMTAKIRKFYQRNRSFSACNAFIAVVGNEPRVRLKNSLVCPPHHLTSYLSISSAFKDGKITVGLDLGLPITVAARSKA
jgi:hypothetical protein